MSASLGLTAIIACNAAGGSAGDEAEQTSEALAAATAVTVAAPPTCAPPAALSCTPATGCRCVPNPTSLLPLPARDIAAGPAQVYLIKPDGTVWVWGSSGIDDTIHFFGDNNIADADGNPWSTQVTSPTLLPTVATTANPALALAAGSTGACALLQDGTVSCWGKLTSDIQDPALVPASGGGVLSHVVSITRGDGHACAITRNGTDVKSAAAVCWGNNQYGQLGTGTAVSSDVPVAVVDPTAIPGSAVQVVAAANATCVLYADGHVSCFGLGGNGEMGNGAQSNNPFASTYLKPVSPGAPLAPLAHIDSIYGGGNGSFCAHRPTTSITAPVTPPVIGDASTDAAHPDSGVTTLPDATFCWGYNGKSPIPGAPQVPAVIDGAGASTLAPVDISSATLSSHAPFTARALGWSNGCDWAVNGQAACWGANDSGQLLTADPTKTTPRTLNLNYVYKMAVGSGFICAITRVQVACFGLNQSGQLGLGNTDPTTGIQVPVGVPTTYCPPFYAVTSSFSGSSADNVHCDVVPGTMAFDVFTKWTSLGRESGILGYPTSGQISEQAGGAWFNSTTFAKQNGRIYESRAGGTHYVTGPIGAELQVLGGVGYNVNGVFLGALTNDPQSDGQGVDYSTFENGTVYATPTHEGRIVIEPFQTVYNAQKATLGYPVTDANLMSITIPTTPGPGAHSADHLFQIYDNGAIYSSPGGTYWVGAELAGYMSAHPPLVVGYGIPTANQRRGPGQLTPATLVMTEDGSMLVSSAGNGAHRIPASMIPAYTSPGRTFYGNPTGFYTFGYPVDEPAWTASKLDRQPRIQHYQSGLIVASNQGVFGVVGEFYSLYETCLGIPIGGQSSLNVFGSTYEVQYFEHGSIVHRIGAAAPVVTCD